VSIKDFDGAIEDGNPLDRCKIEMQG